MARLKLVLSLLLTAALLAFGACLPRIVAAVQDNSSIGQASYGNVPSVELDIRQNVPTLGKLAMIDRMSGTIAIAPDKANMTQDEVLQAVQEALDPYIAAGILADYSPADVIELHPLLAQMPDQPELSGVFWTVVVSCGRKDFYLADLAIDDETGKLLRISFTCENRDSGLLQEDILRLFADIYFTELEIPDYQDFATDELDRYYIGDNTAGIRYRFVNPDYGSVVVDLIVHGQGFYTAFHEVMGK